MKAIFYCLVILFFHNSCQGQTSKSLDSFFTFYLADVYKDSKHIIIEQDSCIFTKSNNYKLKKVKKVKTIDYKSNEQRKTCFINFSGFGKVEIDTEVSNYYLNFIITKRYKKSKDYFTAEDFSFLIEQEEKFLNVYIAGLTNMLIGKVYLEELPECIKAIED